MQKINPFLWYDKEAGEAARLYTSIFDNSRINQTTILHDTPSGTVEIVAIEVMGYAITMMSAGPLFKFTPAISLLVNCPTAVKVDEIWKQLSEGGSVLMPLDRYPFSEKYGWLQDRYGLSWQIMLASGQIQQPVVPTLMFVGNLAGKTEDAIRFYTTVFHDSKAGEMLRYGKNEPPDQEDTVKYGQFTIEGQRFAAMDSAHNHNFTFNEAISFEVHCNNQDEIDYYWEKLSADPAAEVCGWLKDRYGVSWQIVPIALNRMLGDKDQQKVARVTQAFLKMKKMDISALQRAYEGR